MLNGTGTIYDGGFRTDLNIIIAVVNQLFGPVGGGGCDSDKRDRAAS